MGKRSDKPRNPDVEFTATVKAKKLRFDEVPDTEVHPPAQTERQNLPDPVQQEHAGITFRNISIDARIANELTVSESDRWKESREAETEMFNRRHNSGKPSHAAEPKKEETQKENK